MDFLQLVKERYSVRKFKPQAVEPEKLEQILEAGRVAPTGCNYQPQRVLVIREGEAYEKLKQCTRYHFDAPVVLLICYDESTCWKHRANGVMGGEIDASIVTDHMMLSAAALGLGTTWVGAFDHQKTRELFALPDYLVPVALLPIGYPADDAKPSHLHEKRFDMDDSVFYNTFDGLTEGEIH